MTRPALLLALAAACALALPARAQTTYQLDPQRGWSPTQDNPADPDLAAISDTRRMLADDHPDLAFDTINAWIESHEGTDHPALPQAYLLRGNAKLARGREYKALFDYEKVIREYPASQVFAAALEKELEVAVAYLNGLKRRSFGIRFESGTDLAEEIIIRINERLPGSRLAEQALMELADYYYRDRDLKMAATAYDCFLILYPQSELREHALQRRAFATIAQFKGPRYDASGLIEAGYQIKDFQREFPIQAQATGMGDALTARLDESAAAQLLTVARWYLRHDNPPSARLTLARLIRKHPATAAAQQGVSIMQQHGWLQPEPPPEKSVRLAAEPPSLETLLAGLPPTGDPPTLIAPAAKPNLRAALNAARLTRLADASSLSRAASEVMR